MTMYMPLNRTMQKLMIEQNQCICNILRFYRSYKIINAIIEQFSRNSLQFVANAYKDNTMKE